MPNEPFSAHSQHGLDLARSKHQLFCRIDEHTWIVPSATCSHHEYLVDLSRLTCTCTDADEDGGTICKHLWAVLHLDNGLTLHDGTHAAPPPVADGNGSCIEVDRGGAS